MNDQNTEILKRAFPNVFKQNFYFECGDGWFEIISKIASFINDQTAHCSAVQVKEKFGSLRFYINWEIDGYGASVVPQETLDKIYEFISSMEISSKSVCEDCGTNLDSSNKASQKKLGYWIRNICQECSKSYLRKKNM
jgi:hypothetical protein